MKKHLMLYKTLVIALFVLFIGAGATPVISGDFSNEQDVSSLTFYTFGRSGTKKCELELPADVIDEISEMFKVLKDKITSKPTSDTTQQLKNDFVDLIDSYGLITNGISKDYVISLLNPSWLKWVNGDNPFLSHGFFSSLVSRLGKIFNLDSFSYTGSAAFCSIAGVGSGLQFPPIMIPRPRFIDFWAAYIDAYTTAANLLTGRGFAAAGPQFGLNLGFMGVGLTWAIPGEPAYFAFGGYSLFTMVGAQEVETYPPNREPIISEEVPADKKWSVPLSLSELSFRISDADGDRMDYSVTTDPDIGSGQGFNKKDGRYSMPVSGLEYDKSYSWTVRVSDGESEVDKTFGFFSVEGPPFDPFEAGWQFRKKITVDNSLVAGDLSVFPVVVNIVDSDLKTKAQVDGDDILFMDGPGVANKIYHEFERYDSDTGTLVSWVGLPELYGSSDTDFYLYYGNPSCGKQEFPERVWGGKYVGVWHLDDFQDSTINGNDGTNHGTDDASGKIGMGRGFVETNHDYISLGDMPEPADGSISTATFEAWVNPVKLGDHVNSIVSKMDTNIEPDIKSYHFKIEDSGQIMFIAQSGVWYSEGRVIRFTTKDSVVFNGNWQYIAAVVDLSTSKGSGVIYYDGEPQTIQIEKFGTPPTHFYDVSLDEKLGRAANENGVFYFDGLIDEVRISSTARSNDWLKTTYNSLDSAFDGGFFSVGPEEIG